MSPPKLQVSFRRRQISFILQCRREVRSVAEFDRNLAYIMSKVSGETVRSSGYPDKPARSFLEENPDCPKPEFESEAAEASA